MKVTFPAEQAASILAVLPDAGVVELSTVEHDTMQVAPDRDCDQALLVAGVDVRIAGEVTLNVEKLRDVLNGAASPVTLTASADRASVMGSGGAPVEVPAANYDRF